MKAHPIKTGWLVTALALFVFATESRAQTGTPFSSVTFFGDSRGDFVDKHEFSGTGQGWNQYLKVGADVPWDVQNNAIAGMPAFLLNRVLMDGYLRGPLPTARRYAVEIGGNDFRYFGWLTLYCPFCIPSVQRYVNGQQRVSVKLLKLMARARGAPDPANRVMFIGNFPAIAHGPVSGTVRQQCPIRGKVCTPVTIGESIEATINLWWSELRGKLTNLENKLKGVLGIGGRVCASGNILLDLYCMWLGYFMEGDSADSTMVSFMAFLNLPAEIEMADQEGIHYLPLWGDFTSPLDCWQGYCWVANRFLFRDHLHTNALGYTIMGARIGKFMFDLGWNNSEGVMLPADLNLLIGADRAEFEILAAAQAVGLEGMAVSPIEEIQEGYRYRQLYHNPVTNVAGALYWREDREDGKRVSLVWGGHWYPYAADGAHEGRWGYPDYGATPCNCGPFNDCGGFQFEFGYAMWHALTGTAMNEGAMQGCESATRINY